jgi:hypothetical protein
MQWGFNLTMFKQVEDEHGSTEMLALKVSM